MRDLLHGCVGKNVRTSGRLKSDPLTCCRWLELSGTQAVARLTRVACVDGVTLSLHRQGVLKFILKGGEGSRFQRRSMVRSVPRTFYIFQYEFIQASFFLLEFDLVHVACCGDRYMPEFVQASDFGAVLQP